jgi:hypothetical protein
MSSPINAGEFTQRRALCYMLVQCFRKDQGFKEIIRAIGETIEDILGNLEPRTVGSPCRRLSKEHDDEVRQFIRKMAHAYRIPTDDRYSEAPRATNEQPMKEDPNPRKRVIDSVGTADLQGNRHQREIAIKRNALKRPSHNHRAFQMSRWSMST